MPKKETTYQKNRFPGHPPDRQEGAVRSAVVVGHVAGLGQAHIRYLNATLGVDQAVSAHEI